ncbi:uncharacterized protein BDZ83DRAFT_655910 [Colletotrichum acutatum]|uniref:Uncharacterized protein n=1 Tax=Glomerella acutata TaxID=27357 RepID=A0AAD8UE88_GLOAC|nr:uncharacterized protein BDZ83DRAFT_655910 [Colletotrichum acutatum]KAK1715052.1 hypothetical protein BDZ83DRAFT_655910 [Colletotrichum acutatum]
MSLAGLRYLRQNPGFPTSHSEPRIAGSSTESNEPLGITASTSFTIATPEPHNRPSEAVMAFNSSTKEEKFSIRHFGWRQRDGPELFATGPSSFPDSTYHGGNYYFLLRIGGFQPSDNFRRVALFHSNENGDNVLETSLLGHRMLPSAWNLRRISRPT